MYAAAHGQEKHIRNFQVSNQTGTHVTFSWEIVDGYYNSSSISYFNLMYEDRLASYTQTRYIHYNDIIRNVSIGNVATFKYPAPVEYFNREQYIMWIRVYRSSSIYPRESVSNREYVSLSKY